MGMRKLNRRAAGKIDRHRRRYSLMDEIDHSRLDPKKKKFKKAAELLLTELAIKHKMKLALIEQFEGDIFPRRVYQIEGSAELFLAFKVGDDTKVQRGVMRNRNHVYQVDKS